MPATCSNPLIILDLSNFLNNLLASASGENSKTGCVSIRCTGLLHTLPLVPRPSREGRSIFGCVPHLDRNGNTHRSQHWSESSFVADV